MSNAHTLIDRDDSLLIVIDVQEYFLNKLPSASHTQLLNNICWLIKLAGWCDIPLLITAEEHHKLPVAQRLIDTLPDNTPIYNKLIFGLAHQPNLLNKVRETGRKTAILVGLETDVCVMHSALGLLEAGYRVAVVLDAVGTPAPNQTIGIGRMQQAGVLILNMKGIFYEWLRTVKRVNRFHQEMPHMRTLAGIIL